MTAVLVAACDVGVAAEAAALMRAAHAAAAPHRLGGVLHAAGVLRDRLLREVERGMKQVASVVRIVMLSALRVGMHVGGIVAAGRSMPELAKLQN